MKSKFVYFVVLVITSISSAKPIKDLQIELSSQVHHGFHQMDLIHFKNRKITINGAKIESLLLPAALDDLQVIKTIRDNSKKGCDEGSFSLKLMNKLIVGCLEGHSYKTLRERIDHLKYLALLSSDSAVSKKK
jgi:hypothetical protein